MQWLLVLLAPLFAQILLANSCPQNFAGVSDPRVVSARLLGGLVSKSIVTEHLEFLTGKKPIIFSHRISDRKNPANKEIARLYIVNYLRKLGLDVTHEKFSGGINFVAEIQGTSQSGEVFEITAHYDTVGIDVPGADDNGSGLATVLEAARIFSQHPPKKTLRITFMDLEESGGKGSEAHAKLLKKEFFEGIGKKRKFIGSLVVDMIGYNPSDGTQKVVLELGKQSQFEPTPKYSWERDDDDDDDTPGYTAAEAYALNLSCASSACYQYLRFSKDQLRDSKLKLSVETDKALPDSGDHGSYWEESLPALFLAAPYSHPYVNPANHRSTDTMENINWDYFVRVMTLAIEITANITNAGPSSKSVDLDEMKTIVASEENTAVELSEDNVKALQPPPPPPTPSYSDLDSTTNERYLRIISRIREKLNSDQKARAFLVVEKDLTRCDVGSWDGYTLDSSYVSSPGAVKELIKLFAEAKRPILWHETTSHNYVSSISILARWTRAEPDRESFAGIKSPLEYYKFLIVEPSQPQKKQWIAGILESVFGDDDYENPID